MFIKAVFPPVWTLWQRRICLFHLYPTDWGHIHQTLLQLRKAYCCRVSVWLKKFLTRSSLTDVLSISLKYEFSSLWSSRTRVFTIFTAGDLSVWVHGHRAIRRSSHFHPHVSAPTVRPCLWKLLTLQDVCFFAFHKVHCFYFEWFRCIFRKKSTCVGVMLKQPLQLRRHLTKQLSSAVSTKDSLWFTGLIWMMSIIWLFAAWT